MDKKIFSYQSLVASAFLGGPLAFAAMSIYNFSVFNKLADDKEKIELRRMFIASFVPLAVAGGLLASTLPVGTLTFVAIGLVNAFALMWKKTLDSYMTHGGKNYGTWTTFALLVASAIVWAGSFVGYEYATNKDYRDDFSIKKIGEIFTSSSFDAQKFDQLVADFSRNEAEANRINQLDTPDKEARLSELDTVEELWNKNLSVIDQIDKLNGKPSDLVRRTELITTYTTLRLEETRALRTFILNPSDKTQSDVLAIQRKLQVSLEELENISR